LGEKNPGIQPQENKLEGKTRSGNPRDGGNIVVRKNSKRRRISQNGGEIRDPMDLGGVLDRKEKKRRVKTHLIGKNRPFQKKDQCRKTGT